MMKYQRGQTLLEAVISLAAILLIIAAISVIVSGSLNNSSFISSQNQASKFAQEGIEYIRYIRNSDYATFSGYSKGVYLCMPEVGGKPAIGSIVASPNSCGRNVPETNPVFKRSIQFTDNALPCGGNEVQATISVLWLTGKCSSGVYCQQSILSSCFGDTFNVQPTL